MIKSYTGIIPDTGKMAMSDLKIYCFLYPTETNRLLPHRYEQDQAFSCLEKQEKDNLYSVRCCAALAFCA